MKTPKFWQNLPEKQRKETINTILLLTIVVGGTFGALGLTKVILKTNYPVVVVISGSMLPAIERGDVLIVKGMDPEDIEVGDHDIRNGSIIIYETEGIWRKPIPEPVVHRVVGREYSATEDRYYFITQGDNNTNIDHAKVPEENVLGVVIYQIPKIGKVKLFLEESGLTWLLIVILGVLLVVSIITDIQNPDEESEKESKEDSYENSDNESKFSNSSGTNPPRSEDYDLGT